MKTLQENTEQGSKQFENRKKVSTSHLLIELLHKCYLVTENNSSVRVVFLDYAKAFDRVSNNILMEKITNTNLHPTITKWLAAFLSNRQQFVKLGDKQSQTLHIKGILPQETLFGMEGFTVMNTD